MFYEKMIYSEDSFGINVTRTYPMHFHRAIELIYITDPDGHIEVTVDGKSAVLTEGWLSLAFPYCPHSYVTYPKEVKRFHLITHPDTFPSMEPIFRTKIPCSPFFNYIGADRAALESMIGALMQLAGTKRPEINKIRRSGGEVYIPMLEAILSFHFAHTGLEDSRRDTSDMPLIMRIMKELEDCYTDPEFNLSTAAARVGVTPQYMSAIVRAHTGSTATQLLHYLRISRARWLLRYSTEPISDIALSSGFASLRTFNRVFVSVIGTSPREFRNK